MHLIRRINQVAAAALSAAFLAGAGPAGAVVVTPTVTSVVDCGTAACVNLTPIEIDVDANIELNVFFGNFHVELGPGPDWIVSLVFNAPAGSGPDNDPGWFSFSAGEDKLMQFTGMAPAHDVLVEIGTPPILNFDENIDGADVWTVSWTFNASEVALFEGLQFHDFHVINFTIDEDAEPVFLTQLMFEPASTGVWPDPSTGLPEPGTVLMLGVGLLGLVGARRAARPSA